MKEGIFFEVLTSDIKASLFYIFYIPKRNSALKKNFENWWFIAWYNTVHALSLKTITSFPKQKIKLKVLSRHKGDALHWNDETHLHPDLWFNVSYFDVSWQAFKARQSSGWCGHELTFSTLSYFLWHDGLCCITIPLNNTFYIFWLDKAACFIRDTLFHYAALADLISGDYTLVGYLIRCTCSTVL